MKTIVSNLVLILFPLIIFVIAFYLSTIVLSREIKVVDISSKISNVINEAEIYKQEIKKIIIKKIQKNTNLKTFSFETYYVKFEINIIEKNESIIKYEVLAKPKEKINGVNLLIHFFDEIKL